MRNSKFEIRNPHLPLRNAYGGQAKEIRSTNFENRNVGFETRFQNSSFGFPSYFVLRIWCFLSALFVVVVSGCAPAPAGKLTAKSVSPEMVRRVVKTNHARVHFLSGAGTISVESPEMAQSGSFELLLRKPDSVLVRIEGPFGINVGSVLLTRNGFLFYNSFENKLVTGAVNAANLSRIFKVDLTFDDLLALFVGGDFFEGDEGTPESISVEENQYVITYQSTMGKRRYFVDPTLFLITRIQHLEKSGKLFLEERFERFRTVGEVSLPRYIRLTQHANRRAFSVSYSSVEVNTGGIPLTLDFPPSAERVRWQ